MKLLIADNGKVRNSDDVELAEKAMEAKEKEGPWGVIDVLIRAWGERAPEQVQALRIELDDHRELLDDKKFGQTLGGKDFERRFTLVFPQNLQLMIRSIYKADELPFDREFYQEFARRYPFFKVAEEV